VQSNCLSVVPLETEFGRKRAIDQSSCNKDYSCLKGFCPSFVTVHGGRPRRGKATSPTAADWPALPAPKLPKVDDQPYGMLITGIGGTGVVTIGALIGMAAHLEGKGCSVLDMTGLAQKGGAVVSHIRIARAPEDIHAVRIAAGSADLVLGCDMVVASGYDVLAKVDKRRTRAVINSGVQPTADSTLQVDFRLPQQQMVEAISDSAGKGRADFVDASRLATALMGDSIASNMFMLGYAWQKGGVPLSLDAIERAIELNAVAVAMNKQAFLWGRRAAHDPDAVAKSVAPASAPTPLHAAEETLESIVSRRVAELTAYQDHAYAQRYADMVERTRRMEEERAPGLSGLAEAVARHGFKLMAYKDEYEVARLFSDGRFRQQIADAFEGDYKLRFHLAPPLFARRDPETGHLQKQRYGPWMLPLFRLLAKGKRLRGTRLDVFGYSEERRVERQLVADYEATLRELLSNLTPENHALAVQIASIPDQIRGFGHVKDASLKRAQAEQTMLLTAFRQPPEQRTAAE
jgi:indolepyruvate ferredoxin oxidoreductase